MKEMRIKRLLATSVLALSMVLPSAGAVDRGHKKPARSHSVSRNRRAHSSKKNRVKTRRPRRTRRPSRVSHNPNQKF